jgi:hypothetical protein
MSLIAVATILFASAMAPLADLQWRDRVLLVFASSEDDARPQLEPLMRRAAELEDRDLVLISIIGDRARVLAGRAYGLSATALRDGYGIAAEAPLTVILIGKDGGEKRRSTRALSGDELFGTIDAMPMRRQEMEKRG